jgi:hypothetical protein
MTEISQVLEDPSGRPEGEIAFTEVDGAVRFVVLTPELSQEADMFRTDVTHW